MSGALFPKAYAGMVQRLRVPSGFLLAILVAVFARPTLASLIAGTPLCVAGLWLRGWAAGHLRKNEDLTVDGPYAWLRNPLYAGTLLSASGVVIAAAQPALLFLLLAVFVFIYWPVVEQEESHLRNLFPGYAGYAAAVPALLPKLPRHSLRRGKRFSWAVYRRNREHKALLALLTGYALLIWKAMGWPGVA